MTMLHRELARERSDLDPDRGAGPPPASTEGSMRPEAEAAPARTWPPPGALDALPYPLFALTRDQQLLGANRSMRELLGGEAPVVGTLRELFSEPAHLDRWVRSALLHGEATTKASLNASGRRVDVWLTLRSLPGEDSLLGIVRPLKAEPRTVSREAAAQVDWALHLTEEWSRAVVAAADQVGLGVSISLLGDEGGPRLAFLNAAGAEILGRRQEELLGGPAFPTFTPDLEARLRSASAPALDSLVVEVERPQGGSARLQLGCSQGDYWGRPAVFAFFRDVTRELELEQEARSAQEALVRSLEETARLKTELLNVAAHELSNPLTPIALQVEMLKDEMGSDATEKERAGVEMLDRNVKRVSRLLADLLEVSRMQAGRLALAREPVEVAGLLQDELQTYAQAAARLGVEFVLEPATPARVYADADRVAQVVGNLVNNALRFTPRGGRVSVSLSTTDDEVLVRVADTGAGIRPQDIPRLFQPFSQLHGKEMGGTGLGLYICKGIVEQHGGRIWAESEGPGKGAAFSFSLPRKAPPTRLPPEA